MVKRKRRVGKKKKKSRGLGKFFSKIGTGAGKIFVSASSALGRIPKRRKAERREGLSRRLRELKRLHLPRYEEREREAVEEDVRWRARVELRRPLSERLAENFYGPLKRPATRMMGLFRGIDEDLYKADIKIPPEQYVALILGASIIEGACGFLLGILLFSPLMGLLGGLAGFIFMFAYVRMRPRYVIRSRINEVNQTLPYALRHIATQLSSGIGLPETLTSVGQAGYGVLSEEFARVIRDMHSGMSMERALSAMVRRVESEPLRRAVRQIQRTLRTGGDLADTLSKLADETAFDLRMKLREYTQSLNMMTLIYMFASAVIPALIIVLVIVMQFLGKMTFSIFGLAILYLVAIPLLLSYLVLVFKRMEPRV